MPSTGSVTTCACWRVLRGAEPGPDRRRRGQGHARVEELVLARPGRSGVIYAGSREGTEKLAERLVQVGVPALAYHAGLDKTVRSQRL